MYEELANIPDWIYRQSAVLPYRQGADGLEVLLITSRKGTRWVLPKGIVEPGLTAPQSAAKEAREEAGVEGPVAPDRLGSYRYRKWGGTCRVEVFPMRVSEQADDWPEAQLRRRKWLTVAKAAKRVKEKALSKIIRRLPDAVAADDGEAKSAPRRASAADRQGRVIYLFRHVKSSWDDPSLEDFDRPLAPRGERALEKMRLYMQLADVEPDLVLCSSTMRTRQTLAGILPVLGEDVPVSFDRRIYTLGQRGLLTRLRRLPDSVGSVMMIGHNPAMQALALDLVDGGDEDALAKLQASFPTGALATLVWRGKWSDLGPGGCELHSFVVPRQL